MLVDRQAHLRRALPCHHTHMRTHTEDAGHPTNRSDRCSRRPKRRWQVWCWALRRRRIRSSPTIILPPSRGGKGRGGTQGSRRREAGGGAVQASTSLPPTSSRPANYPRSSWSLKVPPPSRGRSTSTQLKRPSQPPRQRTTSTRLTCPSYPWRPAGPAAPAACLVARQTPDTPAYVCRLRGPLKVVKPFTSKFWKREKGCWRHRKRCKHRRCNYSSAKWITKSASIQSVFSHPRPRHHSSMSSCGPM